MTAQIKFGTDGWRGIIADDFTYESVRFAAQGMAEYIGAKHAQALVVIGYDCRFGSEVFAEEVARVMAGNGLRSLVFDRPSPTQVASWTVIERRASGAAVVTASHNPWLFNGLKYKPETGSSAPAEVIADLEERINAIAESGPAAVRRADLQQARASGLVETADPQPAYFRQIERMVDLEALRGAGLRILHECMHGSGYGYIRGLLEGGSTTVDELHAERNPYFGGVNPEPISQNLGACFETMKRGGYDLAICTDGDADRLGMVDESGRFVNQLQVYALLMLYLFELRGWSGPVVKTINMTSMAEKLAEQFGVEIHEVPVGFKNIAPKMMETDAVLGGEESGGFGFRGHIPERDGILAGLFFADMLARTGRPLSRLLQDLESRVGPHAYARHDVPLARDTFAQERRRILATLREKPPGVVAGQAVERVRDDDGFKFYLADGSWVLVRVSGTEPLMRVYAEASDQDAVEKRLQALEAIVGVEGSR